MGWARVVMTFIFFERQAQRYMANMMLLDQFPPHFALLDGYDLAPDGLLGMMGCPHPKSPRRLYAGGDALSVDLVAARHIGVNNARDAGALREACHWFGDPSEQIEVVGTDEPVPGWRSPYHNEWSTLLSLLAFPVYQYASGRGAVFVPEMDEQAFPPITAESPLLQSGGQSSRRLLGLRHRDDQKRRVIGAGMAAWPRRFGSPIEGCRVVCSRRRRLGGLASRRRAADSDSRPGRISCSTAADSNGPSKLGLHLRTRYPHADRGHLSGRSRGRTSVRVHADLDRTAEGIDSPRRKAGLATSDSSLDAKIHQRLRSLLIASPPAGSTVAVRSVDHLPFLLRSLGTVLRRTRLPPSVFDALSIWTHVAGQTPADAPSALRS